MVKIQIGLESMSSSGPIHTNRRTFLHDNSLRLRDQSLGIPLTISWAACFWPSGAKWLRHNLDYAKEMKAACLTDKNQRLRQASRKQIPDDKLAVMDRATEELALSGITEACLKEGGPGS